PDSSRDIDLTIALSPQTKGVLEYSSDPSKGPPPRVTTASLSLRFTALMMNGRPILIDQPKKGVVIVEHAIQVYQWFGI
ncbi:hypothetical protein V8F44DRAFT_491237, partial [Aspergillus fumigatus]